MVTSLPATSFHVHFNEEPYCTSFSKEGAEQSAEELAREIGSVVSGPFTYSFHTCPYAANKRRPRASTSEESMTTTTVAPHASDTTDDSEGTLTVIIPPPEPALTVDLHAIPCPGCGKPMDGHTCPDGSAPSVVTVTTRSTGKRKKAEDHPVCPHCGGRAHWNNPESIINFECLLRQYGMAEGKITNPYQKMPPANLLVLQDLGAWLSAHTDLTYGKMVSPTGAGGSFSSLRPAAPPRVKKEKPPKAAKGSRIEDLAEGATKPTRKGKKTEGIVSVPIGAGAIATYVSDEEPPEPGEAIQAAVVPSSVESEADKAIRLTEERREKRKALLKNRKS